MVLYRRAVIKSKNCQLNKSKSNQESEMKLGPWLQS